MRERERANSCTYVYMSRITRRFSNTRQRVTETPIVFDDPPGRQTPWGYSIFIFLESRDSVKLRY